MKKNSFLKKVFIYSIFSLTGVCLATAVLVGNANKVNVVKADEITDLTGYTWAGSSSLNANTDLTFSLTFTNNGVTYNTLHYKNDWQGVHLYYDSLEAYGFTSYHAEWKNDVYKTIEITGGTDAANFTLISWLQSNGTLSKHKNITDGTIEIRLTRPNGWSGNTMYLHTWNDGGSTTVWPGYAMTQIENNEYGENVWTWSPSSEQPLYGKIIFNNNNDKQSSNIDSPSGSKAYWYSNEVWQSGNITVTTIDIFLYDYDNIYNGDVSVYAWRDGTNHNNGTFPGVTATKLVDIATNGLIYKYTMSDRYNRVIFSSNGDNQTADLTPTANYCYVKANSIEGKDTWWGSINYVFAHNFSQHTMLMDGTVPIDDHSSTQYCSSRYLEAKTHFNAIMNSGYGQYVLGELNSNFSAAMERFASWARANGESINTSNGVISSLKSFNIAAFSNNSGIIVIIALSMLAIGAASAYISYRKKN